MRSRCRGLFDALQLVDLAIPNPDTWRQQLHSSTEGITAMIKSLFYAFILLVDRSYWGSMYTTVFWALDRGCAVAVFME